MLKIQTSGLLKIFTVFIFDQFVIDNVNRLGVYEQVDKLKDKNITKST